MKALFLMLKELGCWSWLDMEAEILTLPGMRQVPHLSVMWLTFLDFTVLLNVCVCA